MPVETEVIEEVENIATTETIQTVVNGTAADGEQWKEVADVFSHTASGIVSGANRSRLNEMGFTIGLAKHRRADFGDKLALD